MTQSASSASATEILFVDAGVPDDAVLLASLAPNVEVVRLDGARDGLAQITEALAGRTGIDALHVLGHGGTGAADLGSGVLDLNALEGADLSAWRAALNQDADILLYGCAVGAGAEGQALIERLASLTGADVAASNDSTGAAALGGDWALEASTGAIEAALPFSAEAVAAWDHTLHHFRYGTMSWQPVAGGTNEVIIKGLVGWTNDHGHIPTSTPIGGIKSAGVPSLLFGDGSSQAVAVRVIARDAVTNDVLTEFVSDLDGDGTIEAHEVGVRYTYATAGDYTVSWASSARTTSTNTDGSLWQQVMTVDLAQAGNRSPVIATPAVVQVRDDSVFTYQVGAGDTPGDTVRFRYGTQEEFYDNGVTTEATRPTGLSITPEGLITWDVRDATLAGAAPGSRWQVTLVAEDLDANGVVMSSVPVDFVFTLVPAAAQAPTFDALPTGPQKVVAGQTSTFTVVMDDPDSTTGPVVSVLNPPSNDPAVFSTTSSTDGNGRTTLTINFTPTAELVNNNYVLNIRGRDDAGYTSDQNLVLAVSQIGLTAATDTGASFTDAITRNTTPTLVGSAAPLATINVTLDGSPLGTATANTQGNWTLPITAALSDGTYAVAATSTLGSTTTAAGTLSLVIDTVLPTAPATLVLNGAGAGGDRPIVSGRADPNAVVTVLADGVMAGTAPVDGNGDWSFAFGTGLTPGNHAITASAVDVAGNVASSSALPFNVNSAPSSTLATTGTLAQGETLSLTGTLTDPDGYSAVSYQWQRSDGSGGWTSIAGATAATYMLAQDDVGRTVRAVVSYTDNAGTAEQAFSAASVGTVSNTNDPPAGPVTVNGTPTQGEVLTATATLTDADGVGPLGYRWQRDDGLGNFTDIPGATGTTYALAQADVGRAVRAVASYTDGFGSNEEVSGTPLVVSNTNDAPVGTVTVSGSQAQGGVLTATATLTDADGVGTFAWRWQRDDGLGNFTDIAGAASATYALTQADVGHSVRALASYTDGQGTAEEVVGAATSAVANANDAPTGLVTVLGTPTRGEVLTAEQTLADADGIGTVTWRWQRDDGAGSYVDITGAVGPTYTPGRDDIGHAVRAVASYTDGFGSNEETASAGTSAVVPRAVPVAPPVDTVSDTRELTVEEVRARVADGDTFTAPAGADEVRLADGTLSFGEGADASFLTRLYSGALGRPGDARGLAGWSGGPGADVDRVAVARGFLDSPEYQARHGAQTDAQFVDATYREMLLRGPEATGQEFWQQRIAEGASREQVLAAIADSPEARAAWSSTTSAGVFVPDETIGLIRATYRAAFGRDAEAAGLVHHSDNFDARAYENVQQFGDRVQASPEFVAMYSDRTNAEFIGSLYLNALGRAGDAAGVSYYESLLAAGVEDRSDVLLDFVYSPEGVQHLNWVL